jgi:hypothetical protein
MISRFHKGGSATTRAIAIFGAILILVSQAIGVAHFHQSLVPRDGVVTAQLSVDEGLCPICQLALHAPGSLAAAMTVNRSPASTETIFIASPVRFASPVFSTARVRAPPASL